MAEYKIKLVKNGCIVEVDYPYEEVNVCKTFKEAIDFIERFYSETIENNKTKEA